MTVEDCHPGLFCQRAQAALQWFSAGVIICQTLKSCRNAQALSHMDLAIIDFRKELSDLVISAAWEALCLPLLLKQACPSLVPLLNVCWRAK